MNKQHNQQHGSCENWLFWLLELAPLVIVDQFEDSGANRGWHPENDPFRHAIDSVSLPVVRGIEEVVGGFFELCKNMVQLDGRNGLKTIQNIPRPS